ncbi:hypothetical protein GUJ93_ZPchr0008g14148 [Zizania palustris]|nr:hypothetical protein GUJ93_ZPchr0008g14148 [Zizania palustris]
MDAAGGGTGEPFYVVRKGDVIGIYKSLSDCQLQVSNSVCDPSVTVYKGYSLRKETEEYLAARGLRHPLYSINAADARDELFDDLVPCPFQVKMIYVLISASLICHLPMSYIGMLICFLLKDQFSLCPIMYCDAKLLVYTIFCLEMSNGTSVSTFQFPLNYICIFCTCWIALLFQFILQCV